MSANLLWFKTIETIYYKDDNAVAVKGEHFDSLGMCDTLNPNLLILYVKDEVAAAVPMTEIALLSTEKLTPAGKVVQVQ